LATYRDAQTEPSPARSPQSTATRATKTRRTEPRANSFARRRCRGVLPWLHLARRQRREAPDDDGTRGPDALISHPATERAQRLAAAASGSPTPARSPTTTSATTPANRSPA